jgi:zinc/manganese transport system substrate-binding protein
MGDVHPLGNPHLLARSRARARDHAEHRRRPLAPGSRQRAAFEKNRATFLQKLDREMDRWIKLLEPVRGAKVVVFHPDFIYFLTRFGLVQVGTLEDRPAFPHRRSTSSR